MNIHPVLQFSNDYIDESQLLWKIIIPKAIAGLTGLAFKKVIFVPAKNIAPR